MSEVVLYPALFPPTIYMAWLVEEGLDWNTSAKFDKRSWRNRYRILGPHGPQDLSAPIIQASTKGSLRDVQLEQRGNWGEKEWRAIESSYRKASFFEALADELSPIVRKEHTFLIDRIEESMQWVTRSLNIEMPAESSGRVHSLKAIKPSANIECISYRQVFAHSLGFHGNMSIIDLLMNEGPLSYDILREQAAQYPLARIQSA